MKYMIHYTWLYVLCVVGESGLEGEGDCKSQYDWSNTSHVWWGSTSDLHAHAQGLLSSLCQLITL